MQELILALSEKSLCFLPMKSGRPLLLGIRNGYEDFYLTDDFFRAYSVVL